MDSTFLQKVMDMVPLHIYSKDINGVYTQCNQAQAVYFGKNNGDEVVGLSDFDFLPKNVAKNIRENDKDIIFNKENDSLEEFVVTVSGERMFFLSYKWPEVGDDGRSTGVSGVSIDITDYVNRSIHANNTLKEVLRSIPEHVYWKDNEGKFIGCNEQQALSVGFESPDDLVGKTDYDIFPKEQADIIFATDRDIIQTAEPKITIEESNEADGSLVTYKSHKAPLLDQEGNVIGVLGVSINISDKIALEKQLIEKSKVLEQALNDAKAAEKTKDLIVQNMRHDWITPFTGIYSIPALLADDETDADKKEQLLMAAESGQEMMNHVKSILTMIRAIDGIPPVVAQPVNVPELTNKIFSMYKAIAEVKQIALTLNLKADDFKHDVLSDEFRLERILIDLLSNAVKFTLEKGSIAFSVTLNLMQRADGSETHFVCFEIADDGIGLSAEEIRHIYEPFYRASPAFNAKHTGAGAGLTTVKEYLKDLSGEISCTSTPNKGTTFKIAIPYRESLI